MKKIISLFCRNYDGNRLVRDEIVPGAEWVVAGEGVPTEKFDGTACMVRGGRLFKRYDAKQSKAPPADFEPTQDPDPVTGHWPGWVPVGAGPEDKHHRAAAIPAEDGTYELVGPKIQGNPFYLNHVRLWRHGATVLKDVPRDYDGIRDWLARSNVEGVVWHHADGRMVKIKRRDFDLPWPLGRVWQGPYYVSPCVPREP